MTKSKKKVDVQYFQTRVRNPPKISVKGRIGQSTVIRGTEVCSALVSSVTGDGFLVVPCIGGSSVGMSNSASPLQRVANVYNQCLFQSSVMKYIPSVGMTTPGNVTISFFNNSETCHYLLDAARTISEVRDITLGSANSVTHPVWHEFAYAMNLPARRKRFEINNTSVAVTTDTIERDCQGVFIVLVTGAPASTTISTPRRESVMLLEGLSSTIP